MRRQSTKLVFRGIKGESIPVIDDCTCTNLVEPASGPLSAENFDQGSNSFLNAATTDFHRWWTNCPTTIVSGPTPQGGTSFMRVGTAMSGSGLYVEDLITTRMRTPCGRLSPEINNNWVANVQEGDLIELRASWRAHDVVETGTLGIVFIDGDDGNGSNTFREISPTNGVELVNDSWVTDYVSVVIPAGTVSVMCWAQFYTDTDAVVTSYVDVGDVEILRNCEAECPPAPVYGLNVLRDPTFSQLINMTGGGPNGNEIINSYSRLNGGGFLTPSHSQRLRWWSDQSDNTNWANFHAWFSPNGASTSYDRGSFWTVSDENPHSSSKHARQVVPAGLGPGLKTNTLVPAMNPFAACPYTILDWPSVPFGNAPCSARVLAGDTVTWTGWLSASTAGTYPSVGMGMQFQDNNGAWLADAADTEETKGPLSPTYTEYTVVGTAPADGYVMVYVHGPYNSGVGAEITYDYDDFSLVVTPA